MRSLLPGLVVAAVLVAVLVRVLPGNRAAVARARAEYSYADLTAKAL